MNNISKQRSFIVFICIVCIYIYIFITLYILQMVNHAYFLELAQQQYTTTITAAPERSSIYDRHGKVLAYNEPRWSAFIIPNTITKKSPLLSYLKQNYPLVYKKYNDNPEATFLFIERVLSSKQKITLEAQQFSEIHFIKEPQRFYPIQETMHIVGQTDIDNNGLFGIELLCDKQLKGSATILHLERDARSGNFYFAKHNTMQGNTGNPITLTIDAGLQFITYECLKKTINQFGSQEGAVLILDPTTGDILTSAQYPLPQTKKINLQDLEYTKNKIVTEQYELGSVMKVFSALAALEEQVVTFDEMIDCENTKEITLNGAKFTTWKAHGIIPFYQVIEASNNIGTAKVALRLGKKLYDHYIRLGFGQKTTLSWPGEQKGSITHPKYWSKQSIISLSFGYEIASTLLQLAQAFSIFANKGHMIKPRIIKTDACPEKTALLYKPETIEAMRNILEKTVTQGTARKAALHDYKVMAKTGTANMLIDGRYNKEHNTYTFMCLIEKKQYKRIIITFIKDANRKNIYASTVAIPLSVQIAEHMIINDKFF